MAVLDRIATARDPEFAARVSMILMRVCVDVLNEAETVPNHEERAYLAHLHLRAQVNAKAVAAAVIASNATIQGAIDAHPEQLGSNVSDGDIEFVLAGLYGHLATAYATVVA